MTWLKALARRTWEGFVAFVAELVFRVELACEVLAGKKPQERRRRYWNPAREAPVLVDA
jgi:hypothetical protein